MFNVTVIRLRDLLKYIAIIIAIYFFGKFIIKDLSLKNEISINKNDFLMLGINSESNFIKEINKSKIEVDIEKTEEQEPLSNQMMKSIFQVGLVAFKIQEPKETENKTAELVENTEININKETQNVENLKVASTQVVTPNPIKESYNKEYNGIKIKNETDFELTNEILNSDNLSIDTNNVIIFHTHTCESYTQSEKYQYTETRKLQNNRFKLFCCKSR